LLAIFVGTAPTPAKAQSYKTIDDNLDLYCADLPDGTNSVVRVISNNGLHTATPVDPEAEKANIIKLRKDLQKRISALAKIKKHYEPASDISKLKKSFKFIADEIVTELESDGSLDKVTPAKIHKKISAMIALLKQRLTELQEAIEIIDRCVRNEDLIPPPTAPTAGVITFMFNNPDYGNLEVMRGLGVTAILNKKREYGSVCVGAAKVHGRVPIFPREAEYVVRRNPCLMFFQTAFRNFPICHYGAHIDTAVAWFGTTDAGFSQSAVDEKELKTLNNKIASFGPINVRIPTKKKPCRTK